MSFNSCATNLFEISAVWETKGKKQQQSVVPETRCNKDQNLEELLIHGQKNPKFFARIFHFK